MHKYLVLKLNAVTALLCKGRGQKEKRDHLGILPKCLKEISNQDYVIKVIRYHLPTNVKHVLAPKNDFDTPKITW